MQTFSLGFSPCPNDTYIFDAIVHQKIDHPYSFRVQLEDVETLNQLAFKRKLTISKVSVHAWFHILEHYHLLTSGGALGSGCGPLVLTKNGKELRSGKVALPGKYTTAALLFKMAIRGDFEFQYIPFDQIIKNVQEGRSDAGVIIHESRFTYQKTGLECLLDLGEWWEQETGCLIPLGGIMISQKIPAKIQHEMGNLIKQSIEYAEENHNSTEYYIRQNAQEMEQDVIDSHIDLYVNEYSKDFGEPGKTAIKMFYGRGFELGLLPKVKDPIESYIIT
jgi:1,4-dihydroxy-6-naphthoate synthase